MNESINTGLIAYVEQDDQQVERLFELYKKMEETRSGEKLDEVSFFCCLYRACDEVDDRYARLKKSHLLDHYVRMSTTDAFDFTKRAAEHGCTDMYRFLAGKYRDGRGCIRNYEKAAECYLLSGNTQDAEKMKRLFRLEQSYDRAEELLNTDQFEQAFATIQSASFGDLPKAQYKLAELYEKGYRVKQNDDLALRWYRKAADGYDQQAVRRMIEVYRYGELGECVSDFQVFKYEARLKSFPDNRFQ